jgi:hypothetical protein
MVQVEHLAGFFTVLSLRKGEQLSRLTIVKILSEAVGLLTKCAGLHPDFHIAAVRARIVAPELLLIEGRPNEIAFKDLLRPDGTSLLTILNDGWVLVLLVSGGGIAHTHHTSCCSQRACEQSQNHWALRFSMSCSTAQRASRRGHSPQGDRFQIPFYVGHFEEPDTHQRLASAALEGVAAVRQSRAITRGMNPVKSDEDGTFGYP